jgi:hypothetical protein
LVLGAKVFALRLVRSRDQSVVVPAAITIVAVPIIMSPVAVGVVATAVVIDFCDGTISQGRNYPCRGDWHGSGCRFLRTGAISTPATIMIDIRLRRMRILPMVSDTNHRPDRHGCNTVFTVSPHHVRRSGNWPMAASGMHIRCAVWRNGREAEIYPACCVLGSPSTLSSGNATRQPLQPGSTQSGRSGSVTVEGLRRVWRAGTFSPIDRAQ